MKASSRAQDPEGYAKRVAYYKRRAVVKKIEQNGSSTAFDRMTEVELFRLAQRSAEAVYVYLAGRDNPELFLAAHDAMVAIVELQRRGQQLQLDLE